MIVADANLVIYFTVNGAWTAQAERIRSREKVWVVPSLFPHELLSVLTDHIRHNVLTKDEAIRAFRRARSLVEMAEPLPDPISIVQMWELSGCSTYDLEYVWLARELNVPLVTADREVLRAYPDLAISIEEFSGK
jgi:predicted nucleic acid-binding protein